MIDAFIFDLDGVIVDTALYHFKAWKKLANGLGFDFTAEQNEKLKGVSRADSLKIVLEAGNIKKLSAIEIEKLVDKKNKWYLNYISGFTPDQILPGVDHFLKSLQKANYKIALASSSKNAMTILEKIGYINLFDMIVDGTKILRSKPDPEIFLKAAKGLKTKPENCIVFEDAVAGIAAAKEAGMYTIGIGDPYILNNADYVIEGFNNLNILAIQKIRKMQLDYFFR